MGQASVLYTTGTLGPRSPPAPTPPPPPPPPSSWDCRTNKKAAIGTDTNLKYTGDDRSSCTDACEGRSNCVAVTGTRLTVIAMFSREALTKPHGKANSQATVIMTPASMMGPCGPRSCDLVVSHASGATLWIMGTSCSTSVIV